MSILSSSIDIRNCAEELIADLQDLQDAHGKDWTDENFRRLKAFVEKRDPTLECYYRKQGERKEFLWDFIASGLEEGIVLVAESEQEVHTAKHIVALKHDFEKLLYVYAPIRLLITKAKDRQDAQKLADELTAYAQGCCLTFNPGASFILHFGFYYGAGNVSYHWQSAGEPKALKKEKMCFKVVNGDQNTSRSSFG
jgi:hypothetical protein